MFNSPNFSHGGISMKDRRGEVVDAPGYAWVRVDNHLALFWNGNFIGADLDFFVPTNMSGTTIDGAAVRVGAWRRSG